MKKKLQYPNVQDSIETRHIIAYIVQIFLKVVKKDLNAGTELFNTANKFLERKLQVLNLLPSVAPDSNELLTQNGFLNNHPPFENEQKNGTPRDYFGSFYVQNIEHAQKKKSGVVYTPDWLVRRMVCDAYNFLKEDGQESITCLDPCCGTGVFLLEALWYNYTLLPPEKHTLDSILSLVTHCMGMDQDPIACLCTTLNVFLMLIRLDPALATKLAEDPSVIQVYVQDFLLGGKVPFQDQHNLKLLIIGNPPYVFLRNLAASEKSLLKQYYSSSASQFDIYGLFFERSLQLLPLNGIVSFVIPDSVLTLLNRKVTRELLLQKTHILKIWRVGDIFPGISVASVVITAQKVPHANDMNPFFTEIEDMVQGESHSLKKIPQDAFIQAGNSFAPAFIASPHSMIAQLRFNAISISDFNKIQNESEQITIARGIEIGKNGKVVECPKCRAFYPQPAKPIQCPRCNGNLQQGNAIFFIEGQGPTNFDRIEKKPIVLAVHRWHCEDIQFVVWGVPGIKYKNPAIYTDRRVIIRQLLQNGRICASLPPANATTATTTQSSYNLNLPPSLDPLEILAVLNSDVIAATTFEIFSSGKKLFPRVLLHVLKDLPIIPRKLPPNPIRDSLKALAQQFITNPALDADESALNQLNTLVLNYLGCASKDQVTILNAVRKFMEVTQRHGRP